MNDTRDDGWPGEHTDHTALDYCTGVAGERQHPEVAALLLARGGLHASELPDSDKE